MNLSTLGVHWPEFGQCDAAAGVFEDNLHRHVDLYFVKGAIDDIAAKSRAIVEIDPGGDVGNVRAESGKRSAYHFAYYRKGEDFTSLADLDPLELVARAVAANRARAKNPGAAVLAFLHHQFAGARRIPKGFVHRSDLRQWFLKFLFRHTRNLSL